MAKSKPKMQKPHKKTLNPFEVHINKQKMAILGQKTKNDRGLPGVSRAKAIKKRKETLLQEYKLQNKSNKFTDKRIGERSRDMSLEDKAMARFAAVRKRAHSKKSIFNLADDEVLTHKGQTLADIEKFDDPRSDDDDDSLDENKSGKLDSNFVEDAHFGGGMLKKTGKEGAKTHKELIDELIAESKKRKAEKQKIKEATLDLTEKLDTEWKDLLPLVSKNKKNEEEEKTQIDDYDRVMRELRFEARGTVSDRLKTEEEIFKEEKERLEELEKERIERMKRFRDDQQAKPNHRSADDLDDDLVYESDPEYMLTYNKEGESNLEIDAQINGKTLTNETAENKDDENNENQEEEEEADDSSEAETESDDDLSDLKASESEDSDDNEEQTSPQEGNKIRKKLSQRKQSEESDDNEEQTISKEDKTRKGEKSESEKNDNNEEQTTLQDVNKIRKDLSKRKEMMEKAREELPYTFTLPESYENLQKLFENQSPTYQSVIIERMIKCNHPSLGENNKENLGILFAFLLQHLNDCASENSITHCFELFVALAPKIFELAQLDPENAHNSVKEVIKEKHEEYRKHPRNYPGLEVLLFLKLVNLLFTTSDFRHQVVSPCFIFLEQMLTKCRIKSRKDIAYGLFLVTLVLESTALSKRFLPATINYLGGILHLAIPKVGVKLIKVNFPFKATSSDLVLVEDCTEEDIKLKMDPTDLVEEEIDNSFKIRAIYATLKLIDEFSNLLKDLPSHAELFNDILIYLELLPTRNYPKDITTQFDTTSKQLTLKRTQRKLDYIVMEAKKPKALRLYEPKIEEVFDGKRRKVQSKEKAEREKLLYKLKKETKGALREIRRDKSFLGRVKIKQRIQSDVERKNKVKRIFAEASIQQSELNSLERKKKKK